MKFRKHFDYDLKKASDEVAIECPEPTLTVQSMAEDADINVIVARFGLTGKMPENVRVPMYGDFTDVKDYRSALEALMVAQDSFMELPAKVRARFENDPQKLLEFVADDANIKEAQSLGLLKMKEKEDGGSGSESVKQADSDAGASPSAAASGTGGH